MKSLKCRSIFKDLMEIDNDQHLISSPIHTRPRLFRERGWHFSTLNLHKLRHFYLSIILNQAHLLLIWIRDEHLSPGTQIPTSPHPHCPTLTNIHIQYECVAMVGHPY